MKSLSSSYRNETRETNDLPLERACKQTLYKYPITIFQQRVFKVRSACIISASLSVLLAIRSDDSARRTSV